MTAPGAPRRGAPKSEVQPLRETIFREVMHRGIELGALDVVRFDIDELEYDDRTYLKCLYGCPDWGQRHTCPSRPGALKPWEYRKIFAAYTWGVLLHAADKSTASEAAWQLERYLFESGYYFAFALGDCTGCVECAGFQELACRRPDRARPSLHSTGIDVFATAKKFGLPIRVLQSEGEAQNWYTAVLVE